MGLATRDRILSAELSCLKEVGLKAHRDSGKKLSTEGEKTSTHFL